jgi:hypothetical protein
MSPAAACLVLGITLRSRILYRLIYCVIDLTFFLSFSLSSFSSHLKVAGAIGREEKENNFSFLSELTQISEVAKSGTDRQILSVYSRIYIRIRLLRTQVG